MMKNNRYILFAVVFVLAVMANSCEKYERITRITINDNVVQKDKVVTLYGHIVDFSENATDFGFLIFLDGELVREISLGKPVNKGDFSTDIEGLLSNSEYSARCYITDANEKVVKSLYVRFTTESYLPGITTNNIAQITYESAVCNCSVNTSTGNDYAKKGICWNTEPDVSISDNVIYDNTNDDIYSMVLSNLNDNTTYYVRAFVENNEEVAYGDELSFTTISLNAIDFNTSLKYGTVTDIDGNTYKTIEIDHQTWMAENLRTTKYQNGNNIAHEIDDNWTTITTGAYYLMENCTTYQKIYGALYNWYAVHDDRNICPTGWHVPDNNDWDELINNLGGESLAGGKLKEVENSHWFTSNTGATNQSGFTALPAGWREPYNGNMENAGYNAYFWSSTTPDDVNGNYIILGNNVENVSISSTDPNAGLSVRCVKDPVSLATINMMEVYNITTNSAYTGADLGSNGGATVTEIGLCWSTEPNPDIDDDKYSTQEGAFNYQLTELQAGTTYYIRAYAINSAGVAYSDELSFTTEEKPSIIYGDGVTDADGNEYQSVIIGDQEWMAENLKTTRYNDGKEIPNVTDNNSWSELSTPAYCSYQNAGEYLELYGALYNFYTVATGKLCPTGWHVPTDAEWTILENYLGGANVAGGKLKEIGITHWNTPNTGATNSSGFTALPGGYRSANGSFYDAGKFGYWWSSTPDGSELAYYRGLGYDSGKVYRYWSHRKYGFSVRCVKD